MTSSGIPEYFLLCLLYYLIGSVPTAYIILKYFSGSDITEEGSGNVGALNSYEVSKSKTIGVAVLVIDFLKGFIPSVLLFRFYVHDISFVFIPIVLLVAGHNFSVWIKFKGGRGLATTAGIALAVNFWFLILWCTLFFIFFLPKRNVHIGNIAATLLLPVAFVFSKLLLPESDSYLVSNFGVYFSLITAICLLILLKHINPFLDILKNRKK
jgi:glycerol-3-phosphate acyltransferase PlsY